MYKFRDVVAATSDTDSLPSEALRLNGQYIENLIDGYRTLTVSGREALSPNIESFTVDVRDGSNRKSKRYPERIITVQYQLVAKSAAEFRDAYNKLAAILDVEDAELIFNDETDKFFVGTPSAIGEVSAGTNAVIGKFDLTCFDPFKYSVEQYEATPATGSDSIVLSYGGTYKSFPEIEVDFYEETEITNGSITTLTGNGDCGFVMFCNENEKILQFGDPDEKDAEDVPARSEPILNQTFKETDSWDSAAQSLWTLNNGVITPSDAVQSGSFGIKDASSITRFLTAASYGSGSGWHGPAIMKTLATPASDFTLSYKQRLSIGSNAADVAQIGSFQVQLCTSAGANVAGVQIYKAGAGKTGTVALVVDGKKVYTTDVDLSYDNANFGNKLGYAVTTSTITKSGAEITFNVAGVKRSFYVAALKDSNVAKITFQVEQNASYTPLSYNGFYWIRFVQNFAETVNDIPNKFTSNDVLVADCKSGKIYLNDTLTPSLGALGNDWEHFYLAPGNNTIGLAYSDWVSAPYAPTFIVRYREVFL